MKTTNKIGHKVREPLLITQLPPEDDVKIKISVDLKIGVEPFTCWTICQRSGGHWSEIENGGNTNPIADLAADFNGDDATFFLTNEDGHEGCYIGGEINVETV